MLERLGGPCTVLVEPCVLDRDGRLRGDTRNELLVFEGEDADFGVPEEEATRDRPIGEANWDGEIGAHRKMPAWHAVVRGVVAAARIRGDVVEAYDSLAGEGGYEDPRVPRHRETGKC